MITLGKLRQQVYTRLAEDYTNKEVFKKTFNSVMSVLNENKDLKKVFNIYTDIENRYIDSKEIASEFVVEAINEIKSLMTENYISGINKLHSLVGNTICETTEITKNVDILVHKNGYETLVERIESKNFLVGKLTEQRQVSENFKPVTQSILSTLLVSKFNDQFANMTESEQTLFKKYTSMTTSEINEGVKNLKSELSEIVESLKENTDLKPLLSEVEVKISNSGNDLLSLVRLEELKNNLS